ncbi:MAG: 4Fe-4S binding protein [Desulfatibacillaceae bacterium]|nr:4Fe-4S binding protein [Desulfatibacillaceae bacterium]
MAQDIYRELQERLDKYSIGFPATQSGIEIELLKELFSQEDARMFLALSPMLETAQSVAQRLSKPLDAVAEQLERMAQAGLLFRRKKGDEVKYGAIPFIHGLFEFQVKRLSSKLAQMVESYGRQGLDAAVSKSAKYFLRVVPVEKSVDTRQTVASFDDACTILKNQKLIVVTDCICRKQKKLVESGCGKPLEACFMFGSMAQYYLDHEMGRRVEADEAIGIMVEAQKAGLVTQPATAQNPAGMCNCCGDCCGVLRSLNALPNPAQMVFSNHVALVNADDCTGCETCMERCQMSAIAIEDDAARVNPARCIGCGLCVTTCPTDAISLVKKPESELAIPPQTGLDQMMLMAKNRGISF